MGFLGPDVKLKPGWRQGWWWRERIPAIIAVVVLAAGIGLAGWLPFYLRDNDEPPARPRDTADNQTAAPTTSTRPREEPPKRPDAMSEPTQAGVEATVRYENDAINYAQRTGDVLPLKRIYDLEHCAVCRGVLAQIEKDSMNGRYLEGASYTVVSVAGTTLTPNSQGEWRGSTEPSIKRDSGRQLEPDGRLVREIAADPASLYELRLSFDSGAWRIYGGRVKDLGR